MKVVLLAAGRSLRMQPVADKNFLKFLGVPLIERQLKALRKAGFREILIIGGKHNLQALKKLGCPTREQKNLDLGMAGAVLTAASFLKNQPFLLVSANDVVEESAFELVSKNVKKGEGILLAKKVSSYFPGGYLKINSAGVIKKIVEKPGAGKEPGKLVNIVVHYHHEPKLLLSHLLKIPKRELKHCDALYENVLQKLFDDGVAYRALPYTGFWQPLKYPWHALALMNYFLGNLKRHISPKAQISKSAAINGEVYIDDNVRVLDNAVIQGPAYIGKNTVIATNALVRQSHVGENCVIGFCSEIARSYMGNNVWTHANYIGDSVIGSDVSFGSGAVTGNLRLDEKPVKVTVTKKWNGSVEEEKIDTGLTKLGLITGDHIRVGVNTSFMPGVKVGSNVFVGAGIAVGQDVPEGSFIRGEWILKISQNREKITPRL